MVRIPDFPPSNGGRRPLGDDPHADQRAADAAHRAAQQAAMRIVYGGRIVGYGLDALAQERPALAAIDEAYGAARGQLRAGARAAFDAKAAATRDHWRGEIASSIEKVRSRLTLEVARIRRSNADADLYYAVGAGDPARTAGAADALDQAAQRHALLSGMAPAQARNHAADRVSRTLASGVARAAAFDPRAAQAALDRHGARMSEEDRAKANAALAPGLAAAALGLSNASVTDQKALQLLAARSGDLSVVYDPRLRTLGHYAYRADGSRTFTPMGEGEIQAFKERALNANSYRPGLKSPAEDALDKRIEAESQTAPSQGVTLAQLRAIMPHAGPRAEQYIGFINAAMTAEGITTPARQAAFLAQVASETGDLSHLRENLDYRTLQALQGSYAKFRRSPEIAAAYLNNPVKLGDMQYGRRGNNRPGTDDGFRYRGGGMIQVTGRDRYETLGYANNPEALGTPEIAARTGARYWRMVGLNPLSDSLLTKKQFERVTRTINPGINREKANERYDRYVISARVLGIDGKR